MRRLAADFGRAAALALAATAAGCSLQPVYERPPLPVASAYPTGPAYKESVAAGTAVPAVDIGWRDFLKDPRLQRIVEIALANNRDLRVAALNISQFQAQYRIQRSNLFPQISAGASEDASRAPLASAGRNVTTHVYSVGVAASWELDFFGRLRSLNEQALQQYFASAQAGKATYIALVSQVADQYLTMLAADELLAVTQRTLETAQESYQLTLAQFQAGTGTELAVRQAETVVENAKASYAAQVRSRAQAENGLVLLVGEPLPADLPPGVPFNSQAFLADIPADLPSDLLARRPDIIEAEASLRAANANIGAARAAFFPTINLTGSLGTESVELSKLFGGGSFAWSFVPSITTPIFQGGRLRANLDLAQLQKETSIAQYEKAIQTAFREVADGLAARGTYDDQIASLQRYVAAYQAAFELSLLRFRTGVDSYLNVLTAQNNLYNAEQTLVTARLDRLTNLVGLYQQLGGGWIEQTGDAPRPAEDLAPSPPRLSLIP
ncbi:MAG TPA: efflux transporter outer membrane subunit [Burkholderiales bacterium]|nr:efflux transporter outer membrane subunit [Burkholderiales bacterium]